MYFGLKTWKLNTKTILLSILQARYTVHWLDLFFQAIFYSLPPSLNMRTPTCSKKQRARGKKWLSIKMVSGERGNVFLSLATRFLSSTSFYAQRPQTSFCSQAYSLRSNIKPLLFKELIICRRVFLAAFLVPSPPPDFQPNELIWRRCILYIVQSFFQQLLSLRGCPLKQKAGARGNRRRQKNSLLRIRFTLT